ncbi:MAG: TRAP transporter small permease [Bacteroidota bacterium]
MKKSIDSILEKVLIFIMGVMVVNVLWQVFSRYLLQSPSSWTEELTRFLLIWLGLLGAAYATGQKLHLAIDLLPSRLEGSKARNLDINIQVVVALFGLLAMAIGGSRLVYLTMTLEQISSAMALPMWIVYLSIPISGILIVFYSMENILRKPEQG